METTPVIFHLLILAVTTVHQATTDNTINDDPHQWQGIIGKLRNMFDIGQYMDFVAADRTLLIGH